MKSKKKLKYLPIITIGIVLVILLLPLFLLGWVFYSILYKTQKFDDGNIQVRISRLSNKIKYISVSFNEDMSKKLNEKILLKCIKNFVKSTNAEEFSMKEYNDFHRKREIESIEVERTNLMDSMKGSINKQWKSSLKNSIDHHVVAQDLNNKIEIRLHKDSGLWVSSYFLGNEKFLESVKRQLKV